MKKIVATLAFVPLSPEKVRNAIANGSPNLLQSNGSNKRYAKVVDNGVPIFIKRFANYHGKQAARELACHKIGVKLGLGDYFPGIPLLRRDPRQSQKGPIL